MDMDAESWSDTPPPVDSARQCDSEAPLSVNRAWSLSQAQPPAMPAAPCRTDVVASSTSALSVAAMAPPLRELFEISTVQSTKDAWAVYNSRKSVSAAIHACESAHTHRHAVRTPRANTAPPEPPAWLLCKPARANVNVEAPDA